MKKENKINKKCVQTFFDENLNNLVDDMTEGEMLSLLKELEETRYWIAIVRYVQERMVIAERTLILVDPIKEGTQLARTQGILNGLMDLHNMIIQAKQTIKNAEKKENEKNSETPKVEDELGEIDESASMY